MKIQCQLVGGSNCPALVDESTNMLPHTLLAGLENPGEKSGNLHITQIAGSPPRPLLLGTRLILSMPIGLLVRPAANAALYSQKTLENISIFDIVARYVSCC